MTEISRDEWVKALAEAGVVDAEDDQDAVSISEFAAMFTLDHQTASRRLQRLEAMGKAKRTSKYGRSSDGKRVQFVAYRLVTP